MHATAVHDCVELVEVLDSLEFQAYLFQHRYQPPAVSSLHPCQSRKLIMLALWRTESRECQLPDPVTGLNALLLVEGADFPKEVGQSLILCSWQAFTTRSKRTLASTCAVRPSSSTCRVSYLKLSPTTPGMVLITWSVGHVPACSTTVALQAAVGLKSL